MSQNIQALPNEILIEIFNFCGNSIQFCFSVCKRFTHIAKQITHLSLTKNLGLERLYSFPKLKHIDCVITQGKYKWSPPKSMTTLKIKYMEHMQAEM